MEEMFKARWVNSKGNSILNLLFVMHLTIKSLHQEVEVAQCTYGRVVVATRVSKHMKEKYVHL